MSILSPNLPCKIRVISLTFRANRTAFLLSSKLRSENIFQVFEYLVLGADWQRSEAIIGD